MYGDYRTPTTAHRADFDFGDATLTGGTRRALQTVPFRIVSDGRLPFFGPGDF